MTRSCRGAALVVVEEKGRRLTQKKGCGPEVSRAPIRGKEGLGPVRTLAKQEDVGRGELAEVE